MAFPGLTYTRVEDILFSAPLVGSVTEVTSAVMAAYAYDAEALINAKLSKSYVTPVASTPPILASIAKNISIYLLLSRRVYTQEALSQSTWPDRYKEDLELLDQIADGTLTMTTVDGIPVPGQGVLNPYSNTSVYSPTMTEADATAQFVDPEKFT